MHVLHFRVARTPFGDARERLSVRDDRMNRVALDRLDENDGLALEAESAVGLELDFFQPVDGAEKERVAFVERAVRVQRQDANRDPYRLR